IETVVTVGCLDERCPGGLAMLRMMGGSPDGHEHDNGTLTRPAPIREDGPMDQDRARSLLIAERDEVQGLLKDAEAAGQEDRQSEGDSEAEDEAGDALDPQWGFHR